MLIFILFVSAKMYQRILMCVCTLHLCNVTLLLLLLSAAA